MPRFPWIVFFAACNGGSPDVLETCERAAEVVPGSTTFDDTALASLLDESLATVSANLDTDVWVITTDDVECGPSEVFHTPVEVTVELGGTTACSQAGAAEVREAASGDSEVVAGVVCRDANIAEDLRTTWLAAVEDRQGGTSTSPSFTLYAVGNALGGFIEIDLADEGTSTGGATSTASVAFARWGSMEPEQVVWSPFE